MWLTGGSKSSYKPPTAATTRGGGGGLNVSADRLLDIVNAARSKKGSAAADYAAQQAAEARASATEHARALEMQRRQQAYQRSVSLGQQDYQRKLAEWQSRVEQQNALYLQQRQQWFARQQAEEQRRYELAERAKALEHERQLGISELLQERQSRYAQMAPEDAIRATMFALGLGQGTEPFSTRAKYLKTTLAPLAGVEETRLGQETALSRLLGGAKIGIGSQGVTGLGTAGKAARTWQQGGEDARRLLASAFGVGSTLPGEAPGISQARLQELVGEMTPTGVFA